MGIIETGHIKRGVNVFHKFQRIGNKTQWRGIQNNIIIALLESINQIIQFFTDQ